MKGNTDPQTRAARLFCFCVFAAGAYLFFKYLFVMLFPFMVAFAVSAGVFRVSKRISKVTGMPSGVCAVMIDTLLLALIGFLLFYACRRLVSEILKLIEYISSDTEQSVIYSLTRHMPIASEAVAYAEEVLGERTRSLLTKALLGIAGAVGSLLGAVLRKSPSAVFGGVVAVISVYYMSVDLDKICAFAVTLVPKNARERLVGIKESALYVSVCYLRAYASLFALTFCETLIGLLIVYPEFAFVGALCVAAVDILPVFGAGFVLIPWGLFKLFTGEFFVGVGLLVMYVVITVVRQIAEPKIIGGKTGIHPLAALVSMYLGSRLFGAIGMLLAPMCVSVAVNTVRNISKNKAS